MASQTRGADQSPPQHEFYPEFETSGPPDTLYDTWTYSALEPPGPSPDYPYPPQLNAGFTRSRGIPYMISNWQGQNSSPTSPYETAPLAQSQLDPVTTPHWLSRGAQSSCFATHSQTSFPYYTSTAPSLEQSEMYNDDMQYNMSMNSNPTTFAPNQQCHLFRERAAAPSIQQPSSNAYRTSFLSPTPSASADLQRPHHQNREQAGLSLSAAPVGPQTHHGSEGNTCLECNQSFRYAKDLERHVNSIHRQGRPFACPFGDCKYTFKGFKRKDALNRHIKIVHADVADDEPSQGRSSYPSRSSI